MVARLNCSQPGPPYHDHTHRHQRQREGDRQRDLDATVAFLDLLGLGEGIGVIAGLLHGIGGAAETDLVAAHSGAGHGQIDFGRGDAGGGLERLLDAGGAAGTGHAADGEVNGANRHGMKLRKMRLPPPRGSPFDMDLPMVGRSRGVTHFSVHPRAGRLSSPQPSSSAPPSWREPSSPPAFSRRSRPWAPSQPSPSGPSCRISPPWR